MLRLVVLFISLTVLLPIPALADVRNSRDHSYLERYPRSEIVKYRQLHSADYRWVLGALEKVNGRLSIERQQRLSGQLSRISYQLPDGVSVDEVYSFFAQQLEQISAENLFSCVGRSCGSSNEWANRIFQYFKLYGVERTQRYGAWSLAGSSVSVYVVRRGNRQVFAHVDVLQPDGVDYVGQIEVQGRVEVDVAQRELDEKLVEYLRDQSSVFWLVVHAADVQGLAGSVEAARRYGELFKQRLVAAGVASERLEVFPVGELAMPLKGRESFVVIVKDRVSE